MSDKYPSTSSYAYCRNNPIMLVDPDGMDDMEIQTKYVNDKGGLLYETEDGLNDVIIVSDNNIPELQEKLQEAKGNGTINDPNTNKNEMHKLGKTPTQYKEEPTKGMTDYWTNGYKETYPESYKKGKGVFKDNFSLSQIIAGVVSAFATENNDNTGQERHAGRVSGIQDGNNDRSNGRINRIDPSSSLKNNTPLIRLNTYKKRSYPGIGLPPN